MDEQLQALIQSLSSGDAERRREIAGELGRRGQEGDVRVIPILISLLHDDGPYVDEAASDALWSIGAPAVPALTDLLRDRRAAWGPRQWAARTFMYIGDPRAADPMATVVLDATEDSVLRHVVARYLGYIKADEALEALVTVVTNPEEILEVRRGAAEGLGNMQDRRAFEPLVAALRQDDAQHFHNDLLRALRELQDPRTIDLLLPELGTEDEDRRGSIAAAIGSAGELAIAPLLAALRSEDRRVRSGAATALGFAADVRASGPLAAMLLDDLDVGARRAAASSLSFIKDDRVVPALVGGLRDGDIRVRQSSAHAFYTRSLAGHADVQALPTLRWLAEHDPGTIQGHYAVREAATRAIKEITRER